MNQIIQINIASQAIAIDEKAYETLSNYLKTLESHFRSTASGDEILNDIESRMAEIFLSRLKADKSFVDQQMVDETIALMGSPQEIETEEENASANTSSSSNNKQQGNSKAKKLFRDPDDKILGGVCSGLGAYFGIDTNILRLLTLLIIVFTGVSVIPYIILWAILPKASTPQDKMRMSGEAFDINDIAGNIRNEANDVADSLKKNESLNSGLRTLGEIFETVLRFGFKAFAALFMTLLVIVATVLIVGTFVHASGNGFIELDGMRMSIPQLFESPVVNWIFSTSLLAVIIIPIVTVCYATITFIFNLNSILNVKAVFLAWLISLAILIGIGIFGSGQINTSELQDFQQKIEEAEGNDFRYRLQRS
jgi:phage shock protein PspC (stress-responsive transcriptional regulator)